MKTIETSKDLNSFLHDFIFERPLTECILKIFDNKSDSLLQTVAIPHPITFIRGIQEFCQSLKLPVSDISVQLVGFLYNDNSFIPVEELIEISPYVYFYKSEEIQITKDVASTEEVTTSLEGN